MEKKPPRPSGTSENLRSADLEREPGNSICALCTSTPVIATMEMRPCLRSTARRRTNASGPSLATKPSGSRKPAGACTPSCDSSTARSAVEAGAAAGAWKAAAEERQRAIASFIFEKGVCAGGGGERGGPYVQWCVCGVAQVPRRKLSVRWARDEVPTGALVGASSAAADRATAVCARAIALPELKS